MLQVRNNIELDIACIRNCEIVKFYFECKFISIILNKLCLALLGYSQLPWQNGSYNFLLLPRVILCHLHVSTSGPYFWLFSHIGLKERRPSSLTMPMASGKPVWLFISIGAKVVADIDDTDGTLVSASLFPWFPSSVAKQRTQRRATHQWHSLWLWQARHSLQHCRRPLLLDYRSHRRARCWWVLIKWCRSTFWVLHLAWSMLHISW